jgi:2-octaprenyl-6-methoxyphenol hydroxylase
MTDILIVGGGLAGASLALLLCRQTNFSVTLVEAVNLPPADTTPFTPSFDARSSALSQGSLLIYERLGLLDDILANAAPISLVDVSTRGYLGRVELRAEEAGVPQLGAVIENRRLGRILLNAVHQQPRIRLLFPHRVTAAARQTDGYVVTLDDGSELACRLLVVADGARSQTRELLGIAAHHEDSGEAALVLNVALAVGCEHQGRAWERFLDTGPLAFLPQTDNRVAVIWTGKKVFVDELAALPDEAFLARLQEQATMLGLHVSALGERVHYPLVTTHSAAQAIPFAGVVGNAAHTLHPVAAQGFNLTLRDLDCLAACLAGANHPGELALLEGYVQQRQIDQALIGRASGFLLDVFRVRFAPFAHARQLGLLAMSVLPGLRSRFARRAMGVGR